MSLHGHMNSGASVCMFWKSILQHDRTWGPLEAEGWGESWFNIDSKLKFKSLFNFLITLRCVAASFCAIVAAHWASNMEYEVLQCDCMSVWSILVDDSSSSSNFVASLQFWLIEDSEQNFTCHSVRLVANWACVVLKIYVWMLLLLCHVMMQLSQRYAAVALELPLDLKNTLLSPAFYHKDKRIFWNLTHRLWKIADNM